MDLNKSKDIYILYDNYSLAEAETTRTKLTKKEKEGK